jgi:hypothetical protein
MISEISPAVSHQPLEIFPLRHGGRARSSRFGLIPAAVSIICGNWTIH